MTEMRDQQSAAGELDFVTPDTPIDLTNCDREPIHVPGAIQPHGALLAVDSEELIVRMASRSAADHLGVAATDALGCHLGDIIGRQAVRRVRGLQPTGAERLADLLVADAPAIDGRRFDMTVHLSGGLTIIELEPEAPGDTLSPARMLASMRTTVDRLERAESLAEIANGVAAEMREITAFDRVWVYKFHPDWHGEIIGEAKRDDTESWLGMHYPASDIPAQARALFLRNWLRAIPDVGFTPSPLVPIDNPLDGEPLDLGNAVLRSVSPIHIQYLKNMGVTASLVISLIHRGRLWGLISGHHYSSPKRVPYSTRVVCEFLAHALSLQVGVVDRLEDREQALEIRRRQARLLERLGTDDNFVRTLVSGPVTLADVADADGAAIVRGGDVACVGRTPSVAQIRELVEWIRGQNADAVETSALSAEFPAAEAYRSRASGVLALPISRDRSDQLLWFRGERRQTVRWAGDPRKPVRIDEHGSARLHPRGSFDLWEEEVRGTAEPWLGVAREAAAEMRRAILDLLIHRSEEMARLNEELMAINAQLEETAVELETQTQELLQQRALREQLLESEHKARTDAERANRAKADFLAVMSHELRTPLNAIGGYAELLATGVRGPVSAPQLSDLGRIQVNQRHLLGLINNILNFTKLEAGTVEFQLSRVPVAALLHGVEALIAPQMQARSLSFVVHDCPAALAVMADEEKLRQILLNLLTNALKFTPSGGSVELGCRKLGETIEITVTDTGIGIAPESLDSIFEPFVQVGRELTPANDQGVGLGLAISRELARKMNGDLTATSESGSGSTFRLTLESVESSA